MTTTSSPSEKATLLDKLVSLFLPLAGLLERPVILIADAFYASQKIVTPLLAAGHHLVTRVRSNTVAYEQPPPRPDNPGPGRPRTYGDKVRLRDLWNPHDFVETPSPAYGETGVTIRYLVKDLLWRPVGCVVRFVLVDHPTRGRLILMTTHLGLDPLEVIRLYALRFKMEVSFKQALHTVGAYAYRFWLKTMKKIRGGSGDQYLHRASPDHRDRVWRKLRAYEVHVQLGLIAQGLLQLFAIEHRPTVWDRFRSWMRTMNTDATPSEAVVAQALRSSLPEFLLDERRDSIFEKFLRSKTDLTRLPGMVITP